MFTGIIKEIGALKTLKKTPFGASMEIASKTLRIKPGSSISVDGVCLTATKKTRGGFTADVIPETLSRTHLGLLKPGSLLNLESSLKYGDPINGHILSGHVDTTAEILKPRHGKTQTQRNRTQQITLEIQIPTKLRRFFAEKGSVAVNGVSLTIASVKQRSFTVALTPFTIKHTNLGIADKGDTVNIEIDMLMRYFPRVKNKQPIF